jgi:D-alanine transaminase
VLAFPIRFYYFDSRMFKNSPADRSMIAYFNGRYLSKDEIHISPDDRGFLLGDGSYEVVKIYRGKPFRLDAHLKRFEHSLHEIGLNHPELRLFETVAKELIRRNGMENEDGSLYIQITRGVAPRSHPFPDPPVPPTVYASVGPAASLREKWERGVKIILMPEMRWSRCDVKSISLLANVLASQKAKDSGAEEAVFVRDGFVTEGTHTNVCAVRDGKLMTHPVKNAILDGITREAILELSIGLGIPVEEKPLPLDRFLKSDEIFLLGTTTEIMPVVEVDDRQVGDGTPGPLTRRLQKAFHEMTQS